MDYENASAPAFGHKLKGLTINLVVRDVLAEVAFLNRVFDMQAYQSSRDFAILVYAGQPFQLHADGTYANHPLHALLPPGKSRGIGIELRLHETDPDAAVAHATEFEHATVLQSPRDKPNHGLREAVIFCPEGYAWVPSRRIG